MTPSIGFTPVVLPSKSHQSRNPHRSTGIPLSMHQPAVSYSMVSSAAQSISVTEPGPPNITISVCGSIPSQDRAVQKHPRNPFTFPATPPVSLTNERPAIGVGLHPVSQSKLADTKPPANEKNRHKSEDMPQLSPVKKVEVKKEDDDELVSIPNAYNMRLQTLVNFPNNPVYRPTFRATSVAIHKAKVGCITHPAKSLDVLRQNLQKSINKEIHAVIQSYLDKYFKVGIENIKLNNGENSVTDDQIQAVCRQMLEEAKKMYLSETGRRSVSPAREISDNISETGSTGRRSALGRRRHPSDTDSEAGLRPSMNASKKKKGRYIVNLTGRSTPSKLAMQQSKREGPKFDPERLTEETLFVMGSKANKAMGFGATRGRLYMKHPELFKYSGDQDDKTWLYEHQHMPATGGKSYLIVLDDVRDLALNDEYRDTPGITVESLSGFAVPIWMIEKMRIQMVAMRTDLPKQAKYRSRSTTPNESTLVSGDVNDDESPPKEIKDLPFSSFTSPKPESNLLEASPAEEELDFLSNTGNSNTPTQMSPFNMTGGFDDSVSQSDLDNMDDDPPFQINK
ncbi:Deoxynucleotidyltransferase terminal-interacting protein 1 [Mactra antiquata]